MNMKVKILIPIGMLAVTSLLALTWPRKKEASKQVEKQEPPPEKAPSSEGKRGTADDERRRIMAEMGKKGAAKSAEVRRAKKAAREKLNERVISA